LNSALFDAMWQIIEEYLSCAVEHDDKRVQYKTIQVSRALDRDARALLKKIEHEHDI